MSKKIDFVELSKICTFSIIRDRSGVRICYQKDEVPGVKYVPTLCHQTNCSVYNNLKDG